jgi:cyclic-di-GMP-binding protein
MLSLPPKPTGNFTDPAFKDAAGCAAWLEQLQLTNLQLAHSLLLTQVNLLNRYPMRGLERLDTLEQLRETVHHVQHDYAQKLVAKPLPLNQNELPVFAAVVHLWQAMKLGYQHCLQDYMAGDSQLAGQGALLCQRCLLYGGQAILEHLRTGYEFDPELWQQLHALYAFAEKRKLQQEEVPDALHSTPLPGDHQRSSCRGIYIKTLLACYARPAELTRTQLQRLESWLAQWSSSVSLDHIYTTSKGDAQPLALDLGSSHGLRPVQLVKHSEDMRYLATVPLSKLLRVKTILLQQGKTPQQLELGDYNRDDCIELLLFLHQCWCENRNTRTEARNPAAKHASLCFDPKNIHAQLSGKSSGDECKSTGIPLEIWLVQNESLLGAQLICDGTTPDGRLSFNQLVALRMDDAGNFTLGTTAWANVTRSGQLRIGVRFLPGTVLAVELRPGDADLPVSLNPVPAFLLQAVPALNIPPSLIVPRDWFKAGRVIEIEHPNGEIQNARLGFSVERGIDYERVSYTPV